MTSEPTFAESGEVEPMIRRAVTWLQQNGVRTFWGELKPEQGVLDAVWDVERVPDVESFLALAKASEARMVYVDCTFCKTDGLHEGAKSEGIPELDRLARVLEPHVGELVDASLSWLGGRVLHRFTIGATWANDYFAAWELVEDGSAADEDDEEDDLDEEEVRRHADALARDPRFQAARSTAQRSYAARKILDGSVVADEQLFEAILLEAKNIFDLEIKPDIDKQLADEVQRLKDHGLTKAQIANQLGISANKMKTMF